MLNFNLFLRCTGRLITVVTMIREVDLSLHTPKTSYVLILISQPFLIDGFKFDLRIYTLVTSCDPLRIFVFKDGLGRFATNKYSEPTHNNTVSSNKSMG